MSRIFEEFNMDASESAFASRELEATRARTYDKVYGQLKARDLIPVDNEIDPGAETVRYLQYDMLGVAKLTANYASGFPRADVVVNEFWSPIRGLVSSYEYSVQDMRAASKASRPLEQKRADSAKKAIEQLVESLAQSGDATHGLLGLNNQPNATTYTVASGASGDTEWSQSGGPNKTPDEIIQDMCGIVDNCEVVTKENFLADTLVLPLTSHQYIARTRMGDGNSQTILQHFLELRQAIGKPVSVYSWSFLETAGAGSVKRMIAYPRDPEVLQLVIPQEFEQFAPQTKDMTFHVPCHARCGGVVSYYPLCIQYGDGI